MATPGGGRARARAWGAGSRFEAGGSMMACGKASLKFVNWAAILLKDLASNSNRSNKSEYVIDLLAHLA